MIKRLGGVFFLFAAFLIFADEETADSVSAVEEKQRETLKYGTDAEITALIQQVRTDKAAYLDEDLAALASSASNAPMLSAIFGLFSEREGGGPPAVGEKAVAVLSNYNDETAATVNAAIDYAAKTGGEAYIAPLEGILKDGPSRYASPCIRALGKCAGRDANSRTQTAGFLAARYAEIEDSEERLVILEALGEAASPSELQFLASVAQDEEARPFTRAAALAGLGKIAAANQDIPAEDNEKALAAIQRALTSDSDPNVRTAAVGALSGFSGQEADKAILSAFRDSFYKTRLAAAASAGKRGLHSAVPHLKYRALNDEQASVKEESVRALGLIGGKEAADALGAVFEKGSDALKPLACAELLKLEPDVYTEEAVKRTLSLRGKRAQAPLYQSYLKAISAATGLPETPVQNLVSALLTGNDSLDKFFALDIIKANHLVIFDADVRRLASDKNASLARRARESLAMPLAMPLAEPLARPSAEP